MTAAMAEPRRFASVAHGRPGGKQDRRGTAERGALRGMTLFPPRRPLFRETAGHRPPFPSGTGHAEKPGARPEPTDDEKGPPCREAPHTIFIKSDQLRGADKRT